MRSFLFTLFSLAGAATAQLSANGTNATSSSNSTNTAFPSVDGLQFKIDGKSGYFAGTNSYWLGFQSLEKDVDQSLNELKAAGLKILRVWGFNDVTKVPTDGSVYFQVHQNGTSTVNTGKDGLQRLDYVVKSAEQRGIKLIINFVNNWDDYGGMQTYLDAYGVEKQTSWFTNQPIQNAYQKYIKAVVSRYSNSTAVFAWELANEPRCNGCDTSILTTWIAQTSKYIKSLDPNHMVTIGDEGFGLFVNTDNSYPYTVGEGLNFTTNLALPNIDFGTLHLYPGSWSTSNAWGNKWIKDHSTACKQIGKPCLLEEYGTDTNQCGVEGQWQESALAGRGQGTSGDLFWQFGTTLSWGKTSDDGNTVYTNSTQWNCLVKQHVAAINNGTSSSS